MILLYEILENRRNLFRAFSGTVSRLGIAGLSVRLIRRTESCNETPPAVSGCRQLLLPGIAGPHLRQPPKADCTPYEGMMYTWQP